MSSMSYFEKEDIIHIKIKDGDEVDSVEISPNITAEFDANKDIIGIEILNAATYLRDSLLETIEAQIPHRDA